MQSELRNEKISKAKFRKKIREWKFLKDHEKDVEELFSIYSIELSSVITNLESYFPRSNLEQAAEDSGSVHYSGSDFSEPEIPSSMKNSEDTPDWIKKLYKKIAKETHPDIVSGMDISDFEKSIREGMFKKTGDSIEQKNYDTLLEFAYDLDIDVDTEEIRNSGIIDTSIDKIRKSISDKTNDTCWTWGELEGNAKERSKLISWTRSTLNLDSIPEDIIEDYVVHYENGNLDEWKPKTGFKQGGIAEETIAIPSINLSNADKDKIVIKPKAKKANKRPEPTDLDKRRKKK